MPDDKPKVQLDFEDAQALFDMTTSSMNFGSGFLDSDDVNLLRKLAVLIGVDPSKGTPEEFKSQYPHEYAAYFGDLVCRYPRCGKVSDDPIHNGDK